MQAKRWILTPGDETLSRMDGWRSLGANRYSTCRVHLLISGKRDSHAQNGPSFTETEIPGRASYNWSRKRAQTIKSVTTFETSLKRIVTEKVASEVSSKIGSEVGIGVTSLTAKLQGEMQSKVSSEVAESLERELSQTNSYEVENMGDTSLAIFPLNPNGYPRAGDAEATTLQSLARLAFPASKEERKTARKRAAAKKGGKKAATKKAAKKSARKKAAKKTAAKKAGKKSARKKGARKRTAKKAARR